MTLVAVYMPTRGEPVYEAFVAATKAAAELNSPFHLARGEPVEHVRDGIVADFLKTGASHLCMIDDDTLMPSGALPAMLDAGKPVVTLPTPWLYEGLAMAANVVPVEACGEAAGRYLAGEPMRLPWPTWSWVLSQRDPFRVGATGLSAVVIRRDVFTHAKWPGFTYTRARPGTNGHTVGEDVHFSMWCASRGIEMWALPRFLAGHYKRVDLRDFVPLADMVNVSGVSSPFS